MFSIIVPTYNSSLTLSRCLKSIINQTYGNFEILVIDNCSTDNTLLIAQSFNEKRIKIFVENDKGIYDAMNKGIKLANNEWLYFLGSDDYIFDSSVLHHIYEIIKHNPNQDLIYGNVVWGDTGLVYDGEFYIHKLFGNNICHQSIFTKKKSIEDLGCFNTSYSIHADYAINLSIFMNPKYNVLFTNRIIAFFSSGGYSSKKNDSFFNKRDLLKRAFINKLNFSDQIYFNYSSMLYLKGSRSFLIKLYYNLIMLLLNILNVKPTNSRILKD